MKTRVILTLLVVIALSVGLFATPAVSGGGGGGGSSSSSGDDDRWGNLNASAAGDESDGEGGADEPGRGPEGRISHDADALRFELRVLIDALVIIIVP